MPNAAGLKSFQIDALSFIENWARQRSEQVLPVIEEIRHMSNINTDDMFWRTGAKLVQAALLVKVATLLKCHT
jgi:hypothetical protein